MLLQQHLSLICFKIRSRNEEAINSTRSRIYSLKVFHSLLLDIYFLFLNWLGTHVSDDRKYVCGRRLYVCINTWKFGGLNSREIMSLPENSWGEAGSSKTPLERKILGGGGGGANQRVFHGGRFFFFDHRSVHLFQTNQRFQEIELILWTVLIWKSSKPKLSSQNMRGCSHATIIIPSLHLPI